MSATQNARPQIEGTDHTRVRQSLLVVLVCARERYRRISTTSGGRLPEGEFLVAELAVRNTGQDPAHLLLEQIWLRDAEGRMHRPQDQIAGAGWFGGLNDPMDRVEVQTNAILTGGLWFDVPVGTVPEALVFEEPGASVAYPIPAHTPASRRRRTEGARA